MPRADPYYDGSDVETASWLDPKEIQEMVDMHNMLAGEDFPPIDKECVSQKNITTHESRITPTSAAETITDRDESHLYRADGGGSLYLPGEISTRSSQRGRDGLIVEPIDPNHGQSDDDDVRTAAGEQERGRFIGGEKGMMGAISPVSSRDGRRKRRNSHGGRSPETESAKYTRGRWFAALGDVNLLVCVGSGNGCFGRNATGQFDRPKAV